MCDYSGGIIRSCVRDLLIQDNKRPNKKVFPSILCLITELLEYDGSMTKKLKSDILECDARGVSCGEFTPCLRQFYGFEQEHFQLFKSMQELPKKYQITDQPYKKKTAKKCRKEIAELIKRDAKVYIEKKIAADVIYKLYSYNTWACPCREEEYIATMACLFYFFPAILCLAIDIECKAEVFDSNIQQAIQKCVQFHIKTDELGRKEGIEVEDRIRYFNSLYEIREIELVLGDDLVEDTQEGLNKREYIRRFCDISNDNFRELCYYLVPAYKGNKRMEELIGPGNAKYIYTCKIVDLGFKYQYG